ncbi:hypothetical protein JT305_24340 [Salmonella enterica subsp. enterica serovar Senftenberg]|nr:hypothetical protein [Salmonella enterica subsp. enterica serovar Senftenberg]
MFDHVRFISLARGTHECPQQGGPERRFISLARGTHIVVNHFNDIPGLSAGAGNTTGSRIRQITGAGNTGVGQIPNLNNLVYPLARGTPLSRTDALTRSWFISLARGTRDRPAPLRVRIGLSRWRGNTNASARRTAHQHGLSRWRGEHAGFGVLNFQTRGLSAGAGNTMLSGIVRSLAAVYLAGAGNTAFLISPPRRSTVYLAGAGNT